MSVAPQKRQANSTGANHIIICFDDKTPDSVAPIFNLLYRRVAPGWTRGSAESTEYPTVAESNSAIQQSATLRYGPNNSVAHPGKTVMGALMRLTSKTYSLLIARQPPNPVCGLGETRN